MPIHDWTRVTPGIFHDFHSTWVPEVKRALNSGLLPPDYYALAEQIAGTFGPDVVTLKGPHVRTVESLADGADGGVAVAAAPPKVHFHARREREQYAAKAKAVVVRHRSTHDVIAIIEIVSPGNKSGRAALQDFVRKAGDVLHAGVHLLMIDLFPPGPFDPKGIAARVWEEFAAEEERFDPPAGKPLAVASFIGGIGVEAYIEPMAVGDRLIDMPLFLDREHYVPVPLESTYQSAWEAVPAVWRAVVSGNADRA
jgi:hypothetical protein